MYYVSISTDTMNENPKTEPVPEGEIMSSEEGEIMSGEEGEIMSGEEGEIMSGDDRALAVWAEKTGMTTAELLDLFQSWEDNNISAYSNRDGHEDVTEWPNWEDKY